MEKINGKILTDKKNIYLYIDDKLIKVDILASNIKNEDVKTKLLSYYDGDIKDFIVIDNINDDSDEHKEYKTDKKKKDPKEGTTTKAISDFIKNDTSEASITKLYKKFKNNNNIDCSYTLFYRVYQNMNN